MGDEHENNGARERLRREYRAFVRARHPDRGGDPEAFATELRRWQVVLAAAQADAVAPRLGAPEPVGTPPARPRPDGWGVPPVTVYRRGPWPVRCGRALAAAVRRRRRTRVR